MKHSLFSKFILLVVLFLSFAFLSACTIGESIQNNDTKSKFSDPEDFPKTILVEIAGTGGEIKKVYTTETVTTENERRLGLMNREFLEEDSGMFFVFERSNQLSFWMKNTLIPLDIIFIGEDFIIQNIEYAVPCERDPCENYRSKYSAKYVLEINGGESEKYGISAGDRVILREK